MSNQRAKGQDVSISIIRDDQVEDTLTSILDFQAEDVLEIISKGYLGRTSEDKDMILKGVKFSFKLHIFRQAWFAFRQGVINIATGATPDSSIVISGVINMPSGEAPEFTIANPAFGNMPMNTPGRDQYVEIGLTGEASTMKVQLS